MAEADFADFTKFGAELESTETSPPLKTDPKEVSGAEAAAEDSSDKRNVRAKALPGKGANFHG